MAPPCRLLEASAVKLKPEDTKVKEEGAVTPSPTKKLATEMEKKMKGMPGDTTLVKDRA